MENCKKHDVELVLTKINIINYHDMRRINMTQQIKIA